MCGFAWAGGGFFVRVRAVVLWARHRLGLLVSGGAGQNAAPVTLKGGWDVGSFVGSSRSPVAGVTPVRASDLRGSGLGSGSYSCVPLCGL